MHHTLAPACRPCHATIHQTLSETELAEVFNTVELLRSHPDLSRFFAWAAKQKTDRRITVKKRRR